MAELADGQAGGVSVPTLVMTGGPLDGTAYPLNVSGRQAVVGSSTDADVQIQLGNVEALHAWVGFEAGFLVISDAGSATGTFVNGEKIEGAQPLRDGDRICLGPPGAKGSAKLLVRLPGADAQAATPFADAATPPSLAEESPLPSFGESEPFVDEGQTPDTPPPFGRSSEADSFGTGHAVIEEDAPEVPLAFAPAAEDEDDLFAPAAVPDAARRPATTMPPAVAPPPASPLAPAPAPPRAAAPPPPPPPAAGPPKAPPPPPAPAEEKLTAPPPPPKRAEAAPRPEYRDELPSIPVSPQPTAPARAEPYPSLRSAPRPAQRKGRPAPRRRRRMPSISIPILPITAGLAAVAIVAGLVWLLFVRKVPPELLAVKPNKTESGQTITLSGKNFAKDPAGNSVLFGAMPGKVTQATATSLQVQVPALEKSQVALVVETKGGRSSPISLSILRSAKLTALEPDVAAAGQSVLIKGEGFSGQTVTVQIAGMASPSVQEVPGGIRAVVPAVPLPEGSTTSVVVKAGSRPERSFPLIIGHLPLLLELKPPRGVVGQVVTLVGRGFAASARENAVTFGGQRALVLSADETTLTAVAPPPPANEVQPDFPVVVSTGGRSTGSLVSFGYQRTTTSGFIPRFYAAPVEQFPNEDLAFVSTEIGPVLLLAGAAGASSTAQRAVDVAAALNARVSAAMTRRPQFELRERPQPAVGISGEGRPIVVVTAADAAAYGKPWEGRGQGRSASPAALARHWVALLQDYFALFLYRERPLQMVTLSPRGKILSEIYSEATRRVPQGTNVPTSVVLPTSETMATALRLMALVVSAEGTRAAVAVEGRWRGSIEDPERGNRRFLVELRTDGGRLTGTLTTWQGSIALTSQLREISFERGTLRFTADLQGAPHRFQGTLANNVVQGSIERPNRPGARFTLEFQE